MILMSILGLHLKREEEQTPISFMQYQKQQVIILRLHGIGIHIKRSPEARQALGTRSDRARILSDEGGGDPPYGLD